jgi:hypothetical protein
MSVEKDSPKTDSEKINNEKKSLDDALIEKQVKNDEKCVLRLVFASIGTLIGLIVILTIGLGLGLNLDALSKNPKKNFWPKITIFISFL